jgi:hypothetical protein
VFVFHRSLGADFTTTDAEAVSIVVIAAGNESMRCMCVSVNDPIVLRGGPQILRDLLVNSLRAVAERFAGEA